MTTPPPGEQHLTNVIATFTRRPEAELAVSTLRSELSDVDGLMIRAGDEDDVLDALAVNQRAEMDESIVTASVGLWSGPMIRGGLFWGVIGLVVGAVAAMPILLLVDWPDRDRGIFVLAVAATGALGLSSATFLIGAVRRAQKEGEFTPEDPWAVVKVTVPDRSLPQVMDAVTALGPRSVRHLTAPVVRRPRGDVERPRVSEARAPVDDWPASQPGANSDSA